jgi:hypothetical protein
MDIKSLMMLTVTWFDRNNLLIIYICSAKHGAPKLKHAKDLSDYAQKWAENLAANNDFKHSDCVHKGERIGENICCKWSSTGADYTGEILITFVVYDFFALCFFMCILCNRYRVTLCVKHYPIYNNWIGHSLRKNLK